MKGGDLVVVGDTLLDRDLHGDVERLAPDAPVPVVRCPDTRSRAGGAGLAATLLAAPGRRVVLVTALAPDRAGAELRRLLAGAGVELVPLRLHGATPEKVRVHGNGRQIVRIDHGDRPAAAGALPPAGRRALAAAGAVLVADYGRGVAAAADVRAALAAAALRSPLVWDPHPGGAEPVPGVRLATPNRREAARLVARPATGLHAQATLARRLLERWGAGGVAVTLGADGALLVTSGAHPLLAPAPERLGGAVDTCGAGDRFAAEATAVLAAGGLPSEAVTAAVEAASAFVAAGGVTAREVAGPSPDTAATGRHHGDAGPARPEEAARLARAVRAAGGTVVATGGCFDLLHQGHVELLRAARRLGDCLLVCLNSDASARRLKGAGRPVVPAAARADVLAALAPVDAVVLFDEDTPRRLLESLRPDVWVKGADYATGELPEAAALAAWGGQAVVLPYRSGHSTSELIRRIRSAPVGGPAPAEREAMP